MNIKIFDKFEKIIIPVTKGDADRYFTDVLSCIIHTVVFQRALESVEPTESNITHLDFDYVRCLSSIIEKLVADGIRHIKSKIFKENQIREKNFDFVVAFHWWQQQTAMWPFSLSKTGFEESSSPWEEWYFSIELRELDRKKSLDKETELKHTLSKVVENIITKSGNNLTHLPKSLSFKDRYGKDDDGTDPRTYPFNIQLKGDTGRGLLGFFSG